MIGAHCLEIDSQGMHVVLCCILVILLVMQDATKTIQRDGHVRCLFGANDVLQDVQGLAGEGQSFFELLLLSEEISLDCKDANIFTSKLSSLQQFLRPLQRFQSSI